MTTHDLKTWPEYFQGILDDRKPFEFRREDDKTFAEGDILVLHEWDPERGEYTGRMARRIVTYVLREMGVPEGFACLGLGDPEMPPVCYAVMVGSRCYGTHQDRNVAIGRAQHWTAKYPSTAVYVQRRETTWSNGVRLTIDVSQVLRNGEEENGLGPL